MKKEENNRKLIYFVTAILFLFVILYFIYGMYRFFRHPLGGDGVLRWTENYLTLHHINPMDVVHERGVDLSKLPFYIFLDNTITTIPWSYTLSNILYPGFLPPEIALYWNFACLVLFIVLVIGLISKNPKEKSKGKIILLFTVGIWFAHMGWGSSIHLANNGMFTCLCIIAVYYLLQTDSSFGKDILIGLFMSIAMLKPQTALLFFIPLLFNKKYKSIVISIIVVLGTWLTASVLTDASPISLLTDQFNVGSSLNETSEYVYYGLLDSLVNIGVNTTYILIIQFAVFVPLAFVLGYKFRNKSYLFQFAVMAIISSIWCYNHNVDLPVLGFVALYYAYTVLDSNKENTYLIIFVLFHAVPISYMFYEISFIIPLVQRGAYFAMLLIAVSIKKKEDNALLSYEEKK